MIIVPFIIDLTHAPQTESLYVSVYLTSKAVMENGFKVRIESITKKLFNIVNRHSCIHSINQPTTTIQMISRISWVFTISKKTTMKRFVLCAKSFIHQVHPLTQEIAKFYPELFLNFTKFGTPSPSKEKVKMHNRSNILQIGNQQIIDHGTTQLKSTSPVEG